MHMWRLQKKTNVQDQTVHDLQPKFWAAATRSAHSVWIVCLSRRVKRKCTTHKICAKSNLFKRSRLSVCHLDVTRQHLATVLPTALKHHSRIFFIFGFFLKKFSNLMWNQIDLRNITQTIQFLHHSIRIVCGMWLFETKIIFREIARFFPLSAVSLNIMLHMWFRYECNVFCLFVCLWGCTSNSHYQIQLSGSDDQIQYNSISTTTILSFQKKMWNAEKTSKLWMKRFGY